MAVAASLVNENREAIALQNQIAEDAQEWDDNKRDASYLYVGARLANAREQLAAKKNRRERLDTGVHRYWC